MRYLALIILGLLLMGQDSCNEPINLDSLCIIELPEGEIAKDQIICWVDKEKGEGFTLEQLNGGFHINEVDLRKITERLNECEKETNAN